MSCWVSLFRTQNVKCQGASRARYLPQKNLVSQTYLQTITSSGRNQRDILLSTFKYLSLIYQLILILGTCFSPGFLQKPISDILNVHPHEFCSLAFQIPVLFLRESVIDFLIISWSRHCIPLQNRYQWNVGDESVWFMEGASDTLQRVAVSIIRQYFKLSS